jgi:hypothetical protein
MECTYKWGATEYVLIAVLRIRDTYLSIIPDPDFYPSQILDPKTATNARGENKISCHTFFRSHKFHKIENYLIFEMLKKKNLAQFSKNYRYRTFYPKKLSLSSHKYGLEIRDPRSGKNLFQIPDQRVKKAPDPGSGPVTLTFCCRFQYTKSNF